MSNGTYTPADPAVIAALQGIEAATQAIETAQQAILVAQQQIATAQQAIEASTASIATSSAGRTSAIQSWLSSRWNRIDGTVTAGGLKAGPTLEINSPCAGGDDAQAQVSVPSGVRRSQ